MNTDVNRNNPDIRTKKTIKLNGAVYWRFRASMLGYLALAEKGLH